MDVSFSTLLSCEIKMLVPVAAGFVIAKTGILTERFSKDLSVLLINVLDIFYIFSSVCGIDKSQSSLKEVGTVVLVSLIAHGIAVAAAFLSTVAMKGRDVKCAVRAGIIFRNMGFFGIPLLTAVFGKKGAFWGAINVVVFNVLFWTLCIYIYSRAGGSAKFEIKKVLLNQGIITCVLGLIVLFSGVRIYQPVMDGISIVGSACTPVAMMLVGGILARLSLKELVTSLPVYHTVLISLVIIPVICMFVLKALGFSQELVAFGTLIMGLPAASKNAALAERDGICPGLSAQIVGLAVLFTLVTIPLISLLF